MQGIYRSYIGLFYFGFFAIGAMMPLLSQYFKSIGLNGTQIGIIVSLTSLISILAQPFWGMMCDKTQKTKKILIIIIVITAIISIFIPLFKGYYSLILIFLLLYLFNSGIGPIIETMAINSDIDFGKIRQWGAIGFAMAVFVSGVIADRFGLHWIFIILSISYIIAIFFIKPIEMKRTLHIGGHTHGQGISQLMKNKKYLVFLSSTFFVSGAIEGNNIFFGLLYENLGGTITGIGVAFLLFAGSEAPFMKWTYIGIRKWGVENMLIFSALISMLRFAWYSTNPSPTTVLIFFMIQGISIGTYLVSAAQFIRENTRQELRATAMAIYASSSMGFGGMVCKLVSGIILDYSGIDTVYLFFSVFTFIGIIPLVIVKFIPKYKL